MDNKKKALKATTNVEILPKLKVQKSYEEQLEVMELYTKTHQETEGCSKEERELKCLSVLFPRMLRTIDDRDLIAGRYDVLPVGFGCVTSLGGVGHYCLYSRLEEFRKNSSEEYQPRIDAISEYWEDRDMKSQFINEVMDGDIMNAFSNESYSCPTCGGIRLSGMMLDYNKLLDKGINGLKKEIEWRYEEHEDNHFLKYCYKSLDLFTECCDHYIKEIDEKLKGELDDVRRKDLERMKESLSVIRTDKPQTFHQALQLFWLYALLAGVINYGRIDDVLGIYLKNDLDNGVITYNDAKRMVASLWLLIENKRTTVNGRIIIGGRGRRNPEASDIFGRICLEVCRECRYVEPQFTFRLYEDTPEDMIKSAMDCLADGCTYPTLYNDDVHVDGLKYCMRITEKEAEQYSPFGCGEMNIVANTIGTPNSIINLTKTLNIALNEGVDPFDGKNKAGPVKLKKLEDITSYEDFYENQYGKLHDYYVDLCCKAQVESYRLLNENVSFLFNSILMNDCLERGKALLDGGVRYLGGCCETYGNINCSDSLFAIKKLVFDDKKYTLREINDACVNDFVGYEKIRNDMLNCHKYGNDYDDVDKIACDVYDRVSKRIRLSGMKMGLHYYGIVIINNEANTKWGLKTSASADGRGNLVYLNPSNNPQGGADKNGPTAMLNSLTKFNPKYQVGSVQNIKFQKTFFKENKDAIENLMKGYFKKGGCQLMVTVVDSNALEDAMIHPEKYPDLIVRVSGFSAVFVNLKRTTQEELLSRTLYDELR